VARQGICPLFASHDRRRSGRGACGRLRHSQRLQLPARIDLTGSQGGQYYALATRLAERAKREHGTLTVIPTAGSIENVNRLAAGRGHCAEMFALIQDGTPVPADARLELLGRLPKPESLLLLGRQGHSFRNFSDLRGASIGIGPEGSGTAYLMRQLFEDADLRELNAHLSNHELQEQAGLVAEGKLDLAAFVMQEDAEFLRDVVSITSMWCRPRICRA
jgi:TRAP-type uncharacterized transport system substrate-binding protein